MLEFLSSLWAGHEVQIVAGLATGVSWIVAEGYARNSTWQQGAPRRPPTGMDRGTYPFIALALATSMTFTLVAFLVGLGGYFPAWLSYVGLAVSASGLAVRVWALRTLGRFFTMPITIAEDHQIVDRGPYHWLRHPAYTGGFLTALGMPIVVGTPAGLLFTLAACLSAYIYRIQVEEATLISRFGDSYRSYAKRTSRLIPGIY